MGFVKVLVVVVALLLVLGSALRRWGRKRSNARMARLGTVTLALMILPAGIAVWLVILSAEAAG
ncbi:MULTISPECIES: hypothetical protein [Brevibacterium]|jgi:choline-glycine betaine transporter|uniref:Cardiolipin synthase N-terminal domain-containing protein n=1 Tax=Brevibacterium salitolerans TaxID=1403566 RepID=A0ABN2X5A5_9MICO|nr:hypothetical protein [Brevibacterium sp.]